MTCDCPASSGDGCDAANLGKQLFPGVGRGIKDGVVISEDSAGEVGLAQILPDVLRWVELRTAGGDEHG